MLSLAKPLASRPALPLRAAAGGKRPAGVRSRAVIVPRASATEFVKDDAFSLSKVSFGSIASPIGLCLLIYGFGGYFQILPGE
jgi:hypothetical protein